MSQRPSYAWLMSSKSPLVQCLIVVDMQKAFVEGAGASPQMPRVLPAVRQQVAAARAAGVLVVYLQNDGSPGSSDEPGTSGWELALEPMPTETVVRKSEDSGFVGTQLQQLLQHRQITALSVCGVMSEMCVAATARDAMQRGYEVVLAHDSHGLTGYLPMRPVSQRSARSTLRAPRSGRSGTPSSSRRSVRQSGSPAAMRQAKLPRPTPHALTQTTRPVNASREEVSRPT